jgi:hypothetical protein
MEKIERLFAEKNYETLKVEIYKDTGYKNNPVKLRYLVSAFDYLRDYQGTIAAIELLKPLEPKTAYSMFINCEICLGTNADMALENVALYLSARVTEAEKNWAYFQKSLCLLAKNQKTQAIKLLEAIGDLQNETMAIERHFFLNNAKNLYGDARTEKERINELIIRARIEKNAPLARAARNNAIHANYGEAEYFASAVLAKYCGIAEEQSALLNRFGVGTDTIYYQII